MMHFDRANRLVVHLLFFLCILLVGCQSLPNVRDLVARHDLESAPPSISDAAGPLPLKKSQALISRLRHEAEPTDILKRHIASEEALSGQPLIAGNKVELLCDGPETFASMGEAIRNATDHINLEIFILRDDEIGRALADLLIQKSREGVKVNVLYDSFGAMRTPNSFFDRLRTNGLNVLEFNPLGADLQSEGWGINNRDHRKILVVDGSVAFTGGINFYRVYSRSPSRVQSKGPQSEYYWRDTHIRVEGPAVAEFQRLFLEMWREGNGPDLEVGNYFPELQDVGNSLVRVIDSTPEQPIPSIYAAYISAITHAERSIHLSHAYMLLDQSMLETLSYAAQEGVDVKIILPSFSDFWLPFYAARYNYSTLLKAGVRIFEMRGALLHSKTAVIDGVWSTVGSSNLDLRSFLHDAEVNAVVLGRDFGRLMEAAFAEDLASSVEVNLDDWESRPMKERIKEKVARLFSYWL